MNAVKLILNGAEIEVPEADVMWFIEQKGAKKVNKKTGSKDKK